MAPVPDSTDSSADFVSGLPRRIFGSNESCSLNGKECKRFRECPEAESIFEQNPTALLSRLCSISPYECEEYKAMLTRTRSLICNSRPQPLIVGGTAAAPHEFPHMGSRETSTVEAMHLTEGDKEY
ncbi:unnamed protein product [Darwinula stevensoni]|uniref:Uncharacterized protein n=1 Tax=Darwinula stevensoni TaxID=69355 RepID=A0A7R9FSY2_9CRUS|nr:unnamed protein product [Darwinula stevensoni]CAG0904453.1 unnamed protein product [Darwinula stevensoni]